MKKMKNKFKKIVKDIIIVWTVVFTLLPTLCMGFVFSANEEGNLNTERAGNFAANFAINFYENWSSVSVVEDYDNEYVSTDPADSVLEAGQYIFDKILLNDKNISYDSSKWGRSSEKIVDVNDKSYVRSEGIDCSTFVSAALWLAGYEQFASAQNTYQMIDAIKNGTYASYGMEIYRNDGVNVYKWSSESSRFEILSGVTPYEILQPGDIIVINEHTNIVKKVLEQSSPNKYLALDCGNEKSWQDISYYFANGGNSSSVSTPSSIRGQVKTEYNDTKSIYELVDESASTYEFNNKSWINFVYYKSLFTDDTSKVFKGNFAGSETINASDVADSSTFDNKYSIPGVKDVANVSETLDITQLMSEGKVLPGDILYVNKGNGTSEYLLYVGGTKVIYATNDKLSAPSGALKYEYLENYFKRIRKNLKEGHELEEDFEYPKYGVTEIYRIKSSVADNIKEENANLFFNGKGYYSRAKYDGIPAEVQLFEVRIGFFKWLFNLIKQLLELLANLIVYMFRMQIVGWTNLFENLLNYVLLGITGDYHASGWDALFGTNATSASGERVTVESIFFNKVPILDANFFNFETAGGHSLLIEEPIIGPVQPGQSTTIMVQDENNVVYRLRKTLSTMYTVLRNASIAILLFILIAIGIKIALTSIAEKKAQFKQFLVSWLYAMCVVLFIHFFMYAVFAVNDVLVGVCENINHEVAKESVSEIIMTAKSDEELSLYDAVRVKAYAFDWREGVPATIVYIFLVYLLIRFSIIYFKRFLTIYILALSATFMGVKYAIDKLLGKKAQANTLNKWFKDFSFNVLLQTVHALIYTLFMGVAISVSAESIGGAFIAVIILKFMLEADKIIIKIFGLDKAGSLADVNSPEKWGDVFRKFMPIYHISAGMTRLVKGSVFGSNGTIRRTLDSVFANKAETLKDANKIWEKRKYNLIGRLPIRRLKILSKDLSYDTKKQHYAEIKGYYKDQLKRFTRRVETFKDLSLGSLGSAASLGVMIASPQAGIGMMYGSRKMLSKHKTRGKVKEKDLRYSGRKQKAKILKEKARNEYRLALKKYTDNEMKFQEEYNRLLDDYANSLKGSAERKRIEDEINDLHKARRIEKTRDLHTLQEADEKFTQAKIEFGNAKFEKNPRTLGGRIRHHDRMAFQKVTGITGIGNIAMNESKAAYDTREAAKKRGKKLNDMEKAAELEVEIRKLTLDIKNEIKKSDVSDDEAKKLLEQYMAEATKEASRKSVKSNYVSNAVNTYLYEKHDNKITPDDIDNVLDLVKDGLNKSGKNVISSDEIASDLSERAAEIKQKAKEVQESENAKQEFINDIKEFMEQSPIMNAETKQELQKLIDDLRKTNAEDIDTYNVKQMLSIVRKDAKEASKSIVITDEAKQMIKDEIEKKMMDDNKGLGLEDKDASEIIRKALGKERDMAIKNSIDSSLDDGNKIDNMRKDLLSKLVEMNTYNEVGKIKHKSSMINISKMVKDAKKKEK